MNIYSAIKGLRDGDAVKPTNWRGYVKRVDESSSAYEPYNSSRAEAYPAGTSVLYNNSRYINSEQVDPDPETGVIGSFSYDRWTRVEFDHDIIFIDASDDDGTPNPSATYHGTVTLSGVAYTRDGTGSLPVDMPDADLFMAILNDSWTSAPAADYEAQRTGGGGRW